MMLTEGAQPEYRAAFDQFVDHVNRAIVRAAYDHGLAILVCPCCNMPMTCSETMHNIRCNFTIVKPHGGTVS